MSPSLLNLDPGLRRDDWSFCIYEVNYMDVPQ